MTFATPGSTSSVDFKTLFGHLLIIDVNGFSPQVNTSNGPRDAVKAVITVADGQLAGTKYEDVLVFPKVLVSQLNSRQGQKVLGRLQQGEAKPGQNAPWTLAEATDQDIATATAFLAQQAGAALQQPQPQVQAQGQPAPQGYQPVPPQAQAQQLQPVV